MYNVKIKKVAPIQVATKKASVPNFEDSGQTNVALFSNVRQHILDNGIGLMGYDIALYHGIPGQTELALEAAIPVSQELPPATGIEQTELPAVEEMAYVIHHGDYSTYHLAHIAIQTWMGENGYAPAGAVRDVYLVFDVTGDSSQYVTELQYPVQKLTP